MRKNSSNSSGKPDRDSSFKKDEGRKPFNKDSKPYKKNYDGRQSTGASDGGRPSRPGKPYSGRITDSDKPKRSFDRDGADAKLRKSFDKPGNDSRPFSDRPKRSSDKPSFGNEDRKEGYTSSEYKPRKSFDKSGKTGADSRPFSDRPKRTFDKPAPRSDRPKRTFDKPAPGKDDRKAPYKSGDSKFRKPFDKDSKTDGDSRPFSDKPKRSFDKPAFDKDAKKGPYKSGDSKSRKPFDKADKAEGDSRPFNDRPKRSFDKPAFDKDKKSGGKFDADKKPRKNIDKPSASTGDTRPFRERLNKAFDRDVVKKKDETIAEDHVLKELDEVDSVFKDKPKIPFKKKYATTASGKKKHYHNHEHDDDDEEAFEDEKEINQTNGPRLEMPLNKFIAHSGECSRRDAAELVKQGKVKVNGELVTDPGHKVKHDDKVTLSGKKLTPQKGMVYILLNKPKGFITTNDDPQGRRTVMDLVGNSGVERLFPVGRLDRETSGLLLITNDGDLTQKLCHPAYNIKKVYHVTLDKHLTKADFEKVIEGVELEDGKAPVDEIAYLEKKNEIGLEIHSGKNRIVRRIFESLGYVVEKLDRVMYAGLTKKNLPRSKWRYLDEREVVLLKHFKN